MADALELDLYGDDLEQDFSQVMYRLILFFYQTWYLAIILHLCLS